MQAMIQKGETSLHGFLSAMGKSLGALGLHACRYAQSGSQVGEMRIQNRFGDAGRLQISRIERLIRF
jgi:hypothetical protein